MSWLVKVEMVAAAALLAARVVVVVLVAPPEDLFLLVLYVQCLHLDGCRSRQWTGCKQSPPPWWSMAARERWVLPQMTYHHFFTIQCIRTEVTQKHPVDGIPQMAVSQMSPQFLQMVSRIFHRTVWALHGSL